MPVNLFKLSIHRCSQVLAAQFKVAEWRVKSQGSGLDQELHVCKREAKYNNKRVEELKMIVIFKEVSTTFNHETNVGTGREFS
jgi:hypothetical protein